ncbi:MAG: DUF58 domain-containing protein [Lentisphaerae bacterium]|nr:DUF58 domain-containing protein [Lentisphaerota bacterium]
MSSPRGTRVADPALLDRIKGLSLVARRVVEGSLHGQHASPFRGLSIEFVQHRQYVPGDELRHLDWKVLGRSDRYVLKQYEEETNLRALLCVDCSRSMAYGGGNGSGGSKFDYCKVVAAACGYLMIRQGDRVGLLLAGETPRRQVPPRSSPGHLLTLCQALETAPCAGRNRLAPLLQEAAGSLRHRSLILVFSDLLDDPETILPALGRLHHRGHDVLVFQVLDPGEHAFELGGRGVTVIRDMETGAEFEAEPELIRDLVRAEIAAFLRQVDAGVRRQGIHLVRCTTAEPPDRLLTRSLNERAKLRKR